MELVTLRGFRMERLIRRGAVFMVVLYFCFIVFYLNPALSDSVFSRKIAALSNLLRTKKQIVGTEIYEVKHPKKDNHVTHPLKSKGDNRIHLPIKSERGNQLFQPLQHLRDSRTFQQKQLKEDKLKHSHLHPRNKTQLTESGQPERKGIQRQGGHGIQSMHSKGDNRGFQCVTNDESLYAYSAYYDPRDDPMIRIFVMCTQPFMKISFTCKVHLKTGEIRSVTGSFSISLTYLAYKYKYVSGVVKCPLTSCCEEPDQLESVSLHPSIQGLKKFQRNFTIPLEKLTILQHNLTVIFPGPRTNKLTRCIPPLQNHYKETHKLIWSIEISRLSGADKFIFYNYSISPAVDIILRHYVKEGIAEVRVWNIPRKQIYYFGQMVAELDCLMSQTFSAKYVFQGDVDEIILPQNGLSVVEMANKLFDYESDTPLSNLGSLAFASLSFIRNSSEEGKKRVENATEARYLQIEPLLYTTYFRPRANSKKALVIPERVDRLCVHSACFMRSDFEEKIPHPKKALILHYRDKPRHLVKNETFHDFYGMLKYSNKIVDVISKRWNLIDSE